MRKRVSPWAFGNISRYLRIETLVLFYSVNMDEIWKCVFVFLWIKKAILELKPNFFLETNIVTLEAEQVTFMKVVVYGSGWLQKFISLFNFFSPKNRFLMTKKSKLRDEISNSDCGDIQDFLLKLIVDVNTVLKEWLDILGNTFFTMSQRVLWEDWRCARVYVVSIKLQPAAG